ncbi:hypothetical protein [Salinarimonas chemoclinalis]|uniref:hypothetical protein n=1 Tax=Salinarimonas chemoclinalis TaxID=3241599 RepID=UPI00355891F7
MSGPDRSPGFGSPQVEVRLRLVRDRLGLWWWTLEDEAGAPAAAAREGFTDVRASCRTLAEHIRALGSEPPGTVTKLLRIER